MAANPYNEGTSQGKLRTEMADDTKDMKNAENAPMGKTSSHNIKVYLDNCAYTKWQRQHFDAKTPEQIRAEAERYVTEHPYTGDPSTVI